MKWALATTAALLVLAGTALTARANGARPPVPNDIQYGAREAKIVVEVDEKATQPRLVVPASMIAPAKGKGAGQPGAGAQLPTIMAGLALTAAFLTGGFWLLRKGPDRTLALLLAVSLVVAATSAVQADLPRQPRTTPVKLPADVNIKSEKLVLEVVPFGDSIKLIVPKDAVKQAEKKPEE
jgi:hypothetical protein